MLRSMNQPHTADIVEGNYHSIINGAKEKGDREMKLTCKRCGYSWEARKDPKDIRECPACKSRYWNRAKKSRKEKEREC